MERLVWHFSLVHQGTFLAAYREFWDVLLGNGSGGGGFYQVVVGGEERVVMHLSFFALVLMAVGVVSMVMMVVSVFIVI